MNAPRIAAPLLRDATPADFPAIAAIYAHHVLYGAASFEETPPAQDELLRRHAAVREQGLPWLVAEIDGRVAGYCYATPYRPRAAYRYTIEDSIYIDEAFRGRGLGRTLLEALIARCEAGPWRQMIAVVADPQGGSLALHDSLGFELVGTLRSVGFKHDAWRDTTLMQRTLGEGQRTLPGATAHNSAHESARN
ncbi:GNAT family N-acetyltransferase [Paraburkholderia pallida]|uniref:N-acetyltransferase family protein n=1 Tax=Paraburkholderia pallida TaxID=2547399 RepID=A0A4V1AZP4_9BURK|nr:GNAT family N-acetyltransferase [Paraburkholderia pallida]QBQ99982.1 N-acetyltransferase family protein [Paraburkholderia pallida]